MYIYICIYIYIYICINLLAWTCPLNGQIENGIVSCVGRVVYPDWVTGSSKHDQVNMIK